jgi:16S rRNA (cytosine967-C5)-methyltransferase
MKHFERRVKDLEILLSNYKQGVPFHLHLQQYFKQNKQMGSQDRRSLRKLAYAYWRLGCALKVKGLQEKFALALLILDHENSIELAAYSGKEFEKLAGDGFDALSMFNKAVSANLVNENVLMPQISDVTDRIDIDQIKASYLQESNLWIRTRSNAEAITKELVDKGVFIEAKGDAIAITNGFSLNSLSKQHLAHIEVQDLTSQQAVDKIQTKKGENVWDCCAASGGKSLALMDKGSEANFYLSDIRPNILENLQKRMNAAGHRNFFTARLDLRKGQSNLVFHSASGKSNVEMKEFDHVICDAPCSGSGTWMRNPDQRLGFSQKQLEHYTDLQAAILHNVSDYVGKKGSIWYMTCSVYSSENESQIENFLAKHPEFELIESTYVNGLDEGANVIFFAHFKKK